MDGVLRAQIQASKGARKHTHTHCVCAHAKGKSLSFGNCSDSITSKVNSVNDNIKQLQCLRDIFDLDRNVAKPLNVSGWYQSMCVSCANIISASVLRCSCARARIIHGQVMWKNGCLLNNQVTWNARFDLFIDPFDLALLRNKMAIKMTIQN